MRRVKSFHKDNKLKKLEDELEEQNKHPVEFLRQLGRRKYIQKLIESDIFLPDYWTMYTGKASTVSFDTSSGDCIKLVDEQTHKEIEKLFQETHNSSVVGFGADARGLTHESMKVNEVYRIENPENFANYGQWRKAICTKYLRTGNIPVVQLKGDRTSGKIYDDLVTEINECYLFHGTIIDNMEAIRRQGLDPRISGAGLFGKGIYFTDSSTKADQYAGTSI